MSRNSLLHLARHAIAQIHDEVLLVRALLDLGGAEDASATNSDGTFERAERHILQLPDAATRVVLACDLAVALARGGRDFYRIIDFAKSTAFDATARSQVYVALTDARLGIRPELNLQYAENYAEAQGCDVWLGHAQVAIAQIHAQAGNWSAARCTTRRIKDPLNRVIANCELAICALRQNNEWVFDDLPAVHTISVAIDRVRAYVALTMTFHAMGIPDAQPFQTAVRAAQQCQPEDRIPAGLLLVRALARRRTSTAAERLTEYLPELAQLDALQSICQEAAELGDVVSTRHLARRLMLPGYRDRALYCLVRSAACATSTAASKPSVPVRKSWQQLFGTCFL